MSKLVLEQLELQLTLDSIKIKFLQFLDAIQLF